MRMIAAVMATVLAGMGASAQTSIDSSGVRAPGVRVDASGVHTGDTDVTSRGVSIGRHGGTTINTNGQHRSVDCAGGALTVNGNNNRLQISRCSRVTIAGNSNVASINFARPGGSLAVPGNRNTITWRADRGARVGVSVLGRNNTVNRL